MSTVELLVYNENKNTEKNKLWREINNLSLENPPFACQTLRDLTERLINRKGQRTVCLLALDSHEKLNEILNLNGRDLFRDVRVIMIIPNDDHEFLINAFSLHPRYLTFKDSDYSDISKVLIKTMELPMLFSESALH